MATIDQLEKDRPAYVRFVRRAVEDKRASLEQGRYVAKDVDYALITPPYSRDVVEVKVDQWLLNMDADVRNDRIPQEWADRWKEGLNKWRNGQEIPLSGTPIKGWAVISPAQQETLIRMNILTVEDLSSVNDEGLRRIGMGAMELKNKAIAWLKSAKDHGAVVQQVASLQTQLEHVTIERDALLRQAEDLKRQRPELTLVQAPQVTQSDSITANDILPDAEQVSTRKRR